MKTSRLNEVFRLEAGIIAVKALRSTKLVAKVKPKLVRKTEVLTKFVPLTFNVNVVPPTLAVSGNVPVKTGAGLKIVTVRVATIGMPPELLAVTVMSLEPPTSQVCGKVVTKLLIEPCVVGICSLAAQAYVIGKVGVSGAVPTVAVKFNAASTSPVIGPVIVRLVMGAGTVEIVKVAVLFTGTRSMVVVVRLAVLAMAPTTFGWALRVKTRVALGKMVTVPLTAAQVIVVVPLHPGEADVKFSELGRISVMITL